MVSHHFFFFLIGMVSHHLNSNLVIVSLAWYRKWSEWLNMVSPRLKLVLVMLLMECYRNRVGKYGVMV